MSKDSIQIPGGPALLVDDVASQGNAILGIRDSGKSYTGTWLDEQLMDRGVPTTVIDPIGIWRFLRVPRAGKGGRGFPVVVAGGEHGDLPLTRDNCAEILRAAMRQEISIVFDLFSVQMSKADWRAIVTIVVSTLLHENRRYGLRHLFIEEASEFCPQRVGPEYGRVYAEMEKLARMGGNSLVGYTLINQRPEEVNKAVLELCDRIWLHRQKGRHSITALSKWMDVADATNAAEVRKSLPGLKQGECWLWDSGSATPVRVQIPEKLTLHPDRRLKAADINRASHGKAVDVRQFVEAVQEILAEEEEKAREERGAKRLATHSFAQKKVGEDLDAAIDLDERLGKAFVDGRREGFTEGARQGHDAGVARGKAMLAKLAAQVVRDVEAALQAAQTELLDGSDLAQALAVRTPAPTPASPVRGLADVSDSEARILKVLARVHPLALTRAQWAGQAGLSSKGGRFLRVVSQLRKLGYIEDDGPKSVATPAGLRRVDAVEDVPSDPAALVAQWKRKLNGTAAKLLDVLIAAHPRGVDRETLAQRADLAQHGGAFTRAVGALTSAKLAVADEDRKLRVADFLVGGAR